MVRKTTVDERVQGGPSYAPKSTTTHEVQRNHTKATAAGKNLRENFERVKKTTERAIGIVPKSSTKPS